MTQRNFSMIRIFGLVAIVAGIAGGLYNRHLAATDGALYIKLCVFAPLGILGGLLMAVRPDWAGPLRPDTTRAQKIAMFAVLGLMVAASGAEFYHLHNASTRHVTYTPWTPSMGTPVGLRSPEQTRFPVTTVLAASLPAAAMTFLGRSYQLASFNQKSNPQWEFVPAGERIDDWKTLLTVIDRPDARTRPDLDRLAEGILSTYKSHGAQILMAKTMQGSGAVYNYMVAAFEQPAQRRYELNFVKMELGQSNATIVIYGVRIGDTPDYQSKAKEFLTRNSGEIGQALGATALPDIARLPRKEF